MSKFAYYKKLKEALSEDMNALAPALKIKMKYWTSVITGGGEIRQPRVIHDINSHAALHTKMCLFVLNITIRW